MNFYFFLTMYDLVRLPSCFRTTKTFSILPVGILSLHFLYVVFGLYVTCCADQEYVYRCAQTEIQYSCEAGENEKRKEKPS